MYFSIVIPTCNRTDLLGKCLSKLEHAVQCLDAADYEVIVTDDGTSDSTRSFIEKNYSWVKWIKGPQRGPAANRNNGAKHARGGWIIFLDDDCLPSTGLLRNYSKAISEQSSCKVFEGAILSLEERSSPLQYAPVNDKGGKLWSCNFMIDRSLFFQLEGFDEYFIYPHMEDVDLRTRLLAAREKIYFVNVAYVYHPLRRINNGFKLGKYQEMYVYYKRKHNEPVMLKELLLSIIKAHYSMAKGLFLHRDFPLALFIASQHCLYVLINYKVWKNKYD